MELSIFTYCYNPTILKKLKIDSPTLLCGSVDKNLNAHFNFKLTKQYKSKCFKPILMFDTADHFSGTHCAQELIVNKTTIKNVKKWCKMLAKHSKHIMLDIEPVRDFQIPLYKEIRKQYPYYISGCFGNIINKEILKYVDDSVYMFYDYSTDIKSYKQGITKKLQEILKTKKPFQVGVPIASSFYEFEEIKNRWGKMVLKSPNKMKDYTKACLDVLSKTKSKNSKHFKGIIWWGLYSEPLRRHGLYNYPYKITFNPNPILKKYNYL